MRTSPYDLISHEHVPGQLSKVRSTEDLPNEPQCLPSNSSQTQCMSYFFNQYASLYHISDCKNTYFSLFNLSFLSLFMIKLGIHQQTTNVLKFTCLKCLSDLNFGPGNSSSFVSSLRKLWASSVSDRCLCVFEAPPSAPSQQLISSSCSLKHMTLKNRKSKCFQARVHYKCGEFPQETVINGGSYTTRVIATQLSSQCTHEDSYPLFPKQKKQTLLVTPMTCTAQRPHY